MKRPRITAPVLRGIELLFEDPARIGALFGSSSSVDLAPEDAEALRRAEARTKLYRVWFDARGSKSAEANAERRAHLMAVHAKAQLVDAMMSPSASGMSHREASERWQRIEAKKARLRAGARS